MKTFKVLFEVSCMTTVPATYYDTEMWLEFEAEDIDRAEEECFRAIVYELIEVKQYVLRKLEIYEIQQYDAGKLIQKRVTRPIDDT